MTLASLAADLQRAFSLIRQVQGALDGQAIRSGVAVVTFSASTSSAATTVQHGLDTAPTSIQLTCESTGDARATYSAVDADSFDVKAHVSLATTGNANVSWTATA